MIEGHFGSGSDYLPRGLASPKIIVVEPNREQTTQIQHTDNNRTQNGTPATIVAEKVLYLCMS